MPGLATLYRCRYLASSDPAWLASCPSAPADRLGSVADAGCALLQELGVYLSVAERAVAELEGAEGGLKCLVLANLACVVLLGKDALAAGYARREVTAALSAVDVVLGDQRLAARLWTLELSLLVVCGRVAAEQLERQVLVLLVLLRCQSLQSLKLHKGL